MGSKTTDEPEPIEDRAEHAAEAYDALRPTLEALPYDGLLDPRIDMQKASAHAFGLTVRDRDRSRAAGFQKLAQVEVIGPRPLDRYEQAALATWHARRQQLRFAATAGAKVPRPVVSAASALKKRMLKLADHYFGEHPSYALDLRAIRAGSGHQDTANDLQQLADFVEIPEVRAVLERDPVHYRASDAHEARELAAEILRALGFQSPEADKWTARLRRAYTHMHQTYAEHCYAGSLLFHRIEDVARTYPPSLVTVVRLRPGRSRK